MKSESLYQKFDRLPNSLREKLLQQARGQALCVYEFAITVMGSAPFTIKQLQEKMSAFCLQVTRRQLDNGLADKGLFAQMESIRSGVGRPCQVFRARPLHLVLDDEECSKKGARDSLSIEDLKNVPAYRLAMHKAMILREQEKKTEPHGRYLHRRGWVKLTRGWCANRLGVDKNTIRRYDKRLGVQHQPDIVRQDVYYSDIPLKRGFCQWLEAGGKRFPAISQVLEKLLEKGKVTLATRYANYYWLATP